MIDYIQFTDPESAAPKSILATDLSHVLFLPAIRGRRFDFKPGLNIIVGPNGSGKTSLISAIRRLYFAETVDGSVECYSKFLFGQLFNLSFNRHFEDGFFDLAEMQADYSKPLFSLRKHKDLLAEESMTSAFNLLQSMESHSMSAGENVSYALSALIAIMQGRMQGLKAKDYMDFKRVLKYIEESAAKAFSGSATWSTDGKKRAEKMLAWFKSNDIGPRKQLTAVLDEPDEGFDIYRLNDLLGLLKAVAKLGRDQFIVSLHNVALVNALADVKGVNFIEMSDGYRKAMLDFGKVEDIGNRVETADVSDEVLEFRRSKKEMLKSTKGDASESGGEEPKGDERAVSISQQDFFSDKEPKDYLVLDKVYDFWEGTEKIARFAAIAKDQ